MFAKKVEMMEMIQYRKATQAEIFELAEIRIEVLRAANLLSEDTDMNAVKESTRKYYESRLGTDRHVEILAFEGDEFVGCGSMSIYEVMPTYSNPSGRKGYVMNMYTRPAYRRQGVARKILACLMNEARILGITQVQLEATKAGKPLYLDFGFAELDSEMEYWIK